MAVTCTTSRRSVGNRTDAAAGALDDEGGRNLRPHTEEVAMFSQMQDPGVANRLTQQYSNDRTQAAARHRLARTCVRPENPPPPRPRANGPDGPWRCAPCGPPSDEGTHTTGTGRQAPRYAESEGSSCGTQSTPNPTRCHTRCPAPNADTLATRTCRAQTTANACRAGSRTRSRLREREGNRGRLENPRLTLCRRSSQLQSFSPLSYSSTVVTSTR